eukprot:GGOE01027389.1.p4 GENE.GGOE01027389.1~~GGOE01027389.1.p4  ORF type:complete len:109 (-),score=2.44 GGOE01027389.1:164-490(-)
MPQLQQFDPRWRAALASFIVQPGNPVRCPPLHCGCCLVPFIPSPPPPHCPTATQGAHDLRMAVWVPHCSRLSSIPCHVKRHSQPLSTPTNNTAAGLLAAAARHIAPSR